MLWFVRTWLIWLLALAVPAQGAAAATMVFCGPSHQARVVQGVSAANGEQHHAGHKAQHSGAQHSGLHGDAVASPSDHHSAPSDLLDADTHKCSACASCCSAAALVGAMDALACPEFAATLFDSVVPHLEKFSAEGPDRPPRIRFA
jgi:hypothetical protein